MNKLKIGDKVTLIPGEYYYQLQHWKNKTAIVTRIDNDNWINIEDADGYTNVYPNEELKKITDKKTKLLEKEQKEIKELFKKSRPNSLERHIIIRCSQMYIIKKTKFN